MAYLPHSLSSPIFSACKASLLSLLTTTFENKVLYASPSNRVLTKTPRDFYMPNYEDVSIETRDGEVTLLLLLILEIFMNLNDYLYT